MKQVKSKVYSLNYLIQNPPEASRGLALVWQTAVTSHFAKQGVDLNDKKNYTKRFELKNEDFSAIMKTFKSLAKSPKTTKKVTKKTA